MEQLYFTSAAQLADGRSGFGVLARSAGVTETDIQVAGMYNFYYRPNELAIDAPLSEFPVALSFHRGAEGRCYLTRTVYAGEDFSARQGNFFAHTLVMSDDDLRGLSFAPVLAFDAKVWVSAASDNSALPTLQPFPQVDVPKVSAAIAYLEADDKRPVLFAEILQALVEADTKHRRVLLVAPVNDVLTWLYLVSACVPRELRAALSFSTYQRDPDRVNARIVGVDSGDSAQFSPTQYHVIDCSSAHGLEAQIGTAAGLLSSLGLSGEDDEIADIDAFAETFGVVSWAELDGLVAAWMVAHSELSEVSAHIVHAAKEFFVARSASHGAQVEAAVTSALNQLAGLGEDEVKYAVVNMAATVLVQPEQAERLKTSLARSISAALEEGAAGWLRGDLADDSICGPVVRAAAAMTDITAWAPRMVLRGDIQLLHEVWWVFDAAVMANQEPGDQVWRDVSALVCSQGDLDLGASLLGTVVLLSQQFPTYGRKVADIVSQPMIHCWPRELATFAARLLVAADDGHTPADTERFVWALERSPGKGSEITDVLISLVDDQRKLRSFLMSVEQSAKIREGVAQSASRVTGVEGARLRHVMITTPGCDALIELVRVIDMESMALAGVIALWLDQQAGRLSNEELSILGPIVERAESGPSRVEDWKALYDLRDRLSGDEGLRTRCVAGYLAARPMTPLGPEERQSLQEVLPSARTEVRGRLELLGYLSWIALATRSRAKWSTIFTEDIMPLSAYVTERDLREFLEAFSSVVDTAKLGRLSDSVGDPTVQNVFMVLGAHQHGALCDSWFANVLASQKQDAASLAALHWAWEIALTTTDASRLVLFLGQLKPPVGRQVDDDLRQLALKPRKDVPEHVRALLLEAVGEKRSGGLPIPFSRRRG